MKDRGQFGVLEAVPGSRAALRSHGWLGIALLVIPAGVLGAFAVSGDELAATGVLRVLLPLAGVLALAGAGLLLALTQASLRRFVELTQVLCEHSDSPVFVKDADHRYLFLNEASAALLGRRPADLAGKRDSDVQPGAEALAFEENDRVCLDRDLPTLFRETMQNGHGGERTFLVSKRPLHDARGRVCGLVGAARDITSELDLQKVSRRREDETRVWFDRNPLPVVLFAGTDRRILKVNAAAEQCYGYSRHRMQKMRLGELFAPAEDSRLRNYLGGEARAVPPGSVAWRQRRANGEEFEALTDVSNLLHAETPARVMLVRDVSAERNANKALRDCATRYEDLVESGLAMVWMHDLEGRLLRVNEAMANALGYDRDAMTGRLLADFVAEEEHAHWDDYLDRTHSLKRDAGVLHFVARNGDRRIWQYQFVCYPDAEPTPYVLGAAQDVTLRHRHERRLHEQNQRDPLTGSLTRRFLEDFAQQATYDQAWGCVVVNIDYFRQLNASEGRERGDEVLRDMARLLRNAASAGDTVVRLGGDEFAVLMPHASEHTVRELAERLRVASRDGMPAVFSLGWVLREAGESLAAALRRADRMLLRSRIQERS